MVTLCHVHGMYIHISHVKVHDCFLQKVILVTFHPPQAIAKNFHQCIKYSNVAISGHAAASFTGVLLQQNTQDLIPSKHVI